MNLMKTSHCVASVMKNLMQPRLPNSLCRARQVSVKSTASFSAFSDDFVPDETVNDFKPEMYCNSVTICGEVCWSPKELVNRQTNKPFAFTWGIVTKRLVKGSDQEGYIKFTKHQTKCFNIEKYRDMLEELEVGQRIMVSGYVDKIRLTAQDNITPYWQSEIVVQNITVL